MGEKYLPPMLAACPPPPRTLRRGSRAVLCVAADLSSVALAKEDAAGCCGGRNTQRIAYRSVYTPILSHTLPIHRAAHRCALLQHTVYFVHFAPSSGHKKTGVLRTGFFVVLAVCQSQNLLYSANLLVIPKRVPDPAGCSLAFTLSTCPSKQFTLT